MFSALRSVVALFSAAGAGREGRKSRTLRIEKIEERRLLAAGIPQGIVATQPVADQAYVAGDTALLSEFNLYAAPGTRAAKIDFQPQAGTDFGAFDRVFLMADLKNAKGKLKPDGIFETMLMDIAPARGRMTFDFGKVGRGLNWKGLHVQVEGLTSMAATKQAIGVSKPMVTMVRGTYSRPKAVLVVDVGADSPMHTLEAAEAPVLAMDVVGPWWGDHQPDDQDIVLGSVVLSTDIEPLHIPSLYVVIQGQNAQGGDLSVSVDSGLDFIRLRDTESGGDIEGVVVAQGQNYQVVGFEDIIVNGGASYDVIGDGTGWFSNGDQIRILTSAEGTNAIDFGNL